MAAQFLGIPCFASTGVSSHIASKAMLPAKSIVELLSDFLNSINFLETLSPNVSLLLARSYAERAQHFLEGTGAMVPDRVNGVVYCSLSERAEEMLARQWASELGYKDVVTFR